MSLEQAATIFVVDADEAVRDALATSLEEAGYPVALFGSAQAFLEAYQPDGRACLLVDLDLPGIDGATLLSLLHARQIGLPSIVMSARLATRKLAKRLHGIAGLLEKPFGNEELLRCVRGALAAVATESSSERL